MCGRYTLRARSRAIAEAFDVPEAPELPARYNIAPTQAVPAVWLDPERGDRRVMLFRWGRIPSWADDPSIGDKMINARAETVAEKPAFRHGFRSKRCLVLADGYYEWKKEGKTKLPYFIRMKDDRPFAFAGLWDDWERDAGAILSCTHLTTEPNEAVEPIHDRMPLILPPSAHDAWLDAHVKDLRRLLPLLVPYPADEMEAYPAGTPVNDPANEDERCMAPVG